MRALAILAALAAGAALAGPPRLEAVALSDVPGGTTRATYAATTPKFYLTAKVVDSVPATKVRAEWIAEKTSAAPPNYLVDKFELTIGAQKNPVADFNINKPNAGWPPGDYRADLYIDGKKVKEVKFKVK
jgi:hypothetical protein